MDEISNQSQTLDITEINLAPAWVVKEEHSIGVALEPSEFLFHVCGVVRRHQPYGRLDR